MAARLRQTTSGFGEAATWRAIGAGWRQLFGDFSRLGVSFEWHDFRVESDFDWAPSFHPGSTELCLNLEGEAEVGSGTESVRYPAGSAGFYHQGRTPLRAVRRAGFNHQFITVEMAPAFLARHLPGGLPELHPLIRGVVEGTADASGVARPTVLNTRQRDLIASLRQPPVLASAQALWYQAKAVELMGEFFFQPPADAELFCHRQQRVALDRVESVRAILRRDLAHAPGLEAIAREVGCSPFYLSRTFSKETGQTLPQYLRRLRLEKAADLLRTGRYNVTEAALEVGYNSLSHFSQAFHQHFGCCPGLYPMDVGPGGRVGGR
ncbi:MAG: helix-turn-helix transcriptional regulator [Verrucomicrobiota bacterium]